MPFERRNHPRLVATAPLSCGDVELVQTFEGLMGLHTLSFYFRPRGDSSWSEYYVDHSNPIVWRGSLETSRDLGRCRMKSYGVDLASFDCTETKLVMSSGRVYGPKRVVRDPLAPLPAARSPMDLGASSNEFPGYAWKQAPPDAGSGSDE